MLKFFSIFATAALSFIVKRLLNNVADIFKAFANALFWRSEILEKFQILIKNKAT